MLYADNLLNLSLDRECPRDEPRVNCFVAPCMFATCPAFPQARCVDNYCGGCFADFYLRYRKVDCGKYANNKTKMGKKLSVHCKSAITTLTT